MRALLLWWTLVASLSFVECQDEVVVTLAPVSLSVNEGENANFNCSPVSDEFFSPILNTIPVGSDEAEALIPPRDEITFTDIGDARVFTWLAASLADHGRQFFCQLGSSTSNRATLYINQPAALSTSDSDTEITVKAGETLNVPLNVGGWPIPTLTWTLNGNTITTTTSRNLSLSGLSIPSVSLSDAGTYLVTAENAQNTVSVSFTVTVTSPPVFEGVPVEVLPVGMGEQLVIDCTETANPEVDPTLTRNGGPLMFSSGSQYIVQEAGIGDAGVYECTASNEHGTAIRTITVQVGSLPGKVSDIEIKSDGSGGVTVEWQPANDNGVEITKYNITFSYDGSGGNRNKSVGGTMTMTTLTRDDLPGFPDSGVTLDVTVTITAVNGLGEGESVTNTAPVKVEGDTLPKEPGSTSTTDSSLSHTVCTVFYIVVCTTLLF